jgi:hypothetical protein
LNGGAPTVPNHEDWCTKNKRIIQILTRGLFLTCTDNSFYFAHTNNHERAHSYLKKEKKEGKYPYLEGRSLVHGGNFPFSQVPCLKSIALAPLALPSPPVPASRQKDIYLHTDDINMPAPPDGHTFHS